MSNRAWVTLATNDSYGLGALVLAHSLRRAGSEYPSVVLITPSVTEPMRERLRAVFAEVVTVDVLDSRDAAHLALLQRPELGITFTKIHCWNLTQYEKCVFLDADTLIVRNCDELFEREELSAAPDVGWPDCFNSGVFVFKPSAETFEQLIKFAQERGSFDGGDQGLLNSFFSDWARGDINKHLPFLYNVTSAAFYSYLPALQHYGQNLKIIHFIGAAKPWLQQFNFESRTVDAPDHLREFLQLWWDLFVSQVHTQLDVSMSGVAGNLARVAAGTGGSQREAIDELARRQGWEAGNIDYMGADAFDNILAKITQTLNQPRASPPKQLPPKEPTPPPKQPTPPKESSPPKEQSTVPVAVVQEGASIDAPVIAPTDITAASESAKTVDTTLSADTSAKMEAPVAIKAPVTTEVPVESQVPASTKVPRETEPSVATEVPAKIEAAAPTATEVPVATKAPTPVAPEVAVAIEAPVTTETPLATEEPAKIEATVPVEAPITSETAAPVQTLASTEIAPVKAPEALIATETPAPSESVIREKTIAPSDTTVQPTTIAEVTSDVPVSDRIPKPVESTAEPKPAQVPASPEASVKAVDLPFDTAAPNEAVVSAAEVPTTVEAQAPTSAEIPATVETPAGTDVPISVESSVVEQPKKTEETALPPTPPASPKSSPEQSTPVSESVPKAEAKAQTASETEKSVATSPAESKAEATPPKTGQPEPVSDSPPLANTPSKDEAPTVPAAKSEERRKPAGKLQLSAPAAADPLPTPDSELEDAAALAQSIIASELQPAVGSPLPATPVQSPLPVPPQQQERLSVAEPELPTPPVGTVSLAQIGVKPAKGKSTIAAQIESSVSEKAEPESPIQTEKSTTPVTPKSSASPVTAASPMTPAASEKLPTPETPTSPETPATPVTPTTPTTPTDTKPADAPKKKVVKKVVKKEGVSSGEAPVPPPRKKEKKPKEK